VGAAREVSGGHADDLSGHCGNSIEGDQDERLF
jgi:hypothetical protein